MAAASSKFQYVRELGKGAFGSVILAIDTTTNGYVAVKKINRAQVQGYTESEIVNHSMLRHPHIVKFYQVFLSPTNLNIVMEYVPDGSLLAMVQQQGRLPETTARWLFQQLMFAVDYCHRKGVANRDIKLDNLLLDTSTHGRPDFPILKVCDWGYAKSEVLQSLATSRVGTLAYMAPEVLQAARSHYDGKAADIWSCGVVLYAVLVGSMPFKTGKNEQYPRIALTLLADMQQQRFTLPKDLSPAAQHLVRRLLLPNPSERISIAGIFQHPWFVEGLPASAVSMNDSYARLPRNCAQSIEEIRSIVARAAAADHACGYKEGAARVLDSAAVAAETQ